MKHFLAKIIQGKLDASVHRRFVKFSKGTFPNGGPVVRVKSTKAGNLTIRSSFEYEDLIGYFIVSQLPDNAYKVGGTIYTQPRVALDDIQDKLDQLDLQEGWEKGKRDLKNLFVHPMDTTLPPQEINQLYDILADDCFLFLNIAPPKGKDWQLKTGDKIPPLKKTFGKADPYRECKPDKRIKCKNADLCKMTGICITERTKFCSTKTGPLSPEDLGKFFELFIPDFPEFHQPFTELFIVNQYTINEFIFPENKDSLPPKELREKIKRTGWLERIVYLDDKTDSKKTEFTV